MRVPLIYKEQPIFGFDIGTRSAKVVQIHAGGKHPRVEAYGSANFPAEAIVEGIITDPELIAKALRPMLARPAAGRFTAQRAVISLPAAKVFIRTLQLPPMSQSDLEEAVRFEAEQYVPVPMADLYIDYETFESTAPKLAVGKPANPDAPTDAKALSTASAKANEPHIDVLMVAAPRAIVDSYIKLFDYLNLEVAAIEASLTAITRSVVAATATKSNTLIVDFGSKAADLVVYNQVMRLVGSIGVGGDDLTTAMVSALGIKAEQANEIKYKFGIGRSGLQPKIMGALTPKLATLVTEIKKIIKFYGERSENQESVASVVLSGGATNMPGLVEYLNTALGLPVSIGNPWANLNIGNLHEPSKLDSAMYSTAIGLALAGDKL